MAESRLSRMVLAAGMAVSLGSCNNPSPQPENPTPVVTPESRLLTAPLLTIPDECWYVDACADGGDELTLKQKSPDENYDRFGFRDFGFRILPFSSDQSIELIRVAPPDNEDGEGFTIYAGKRYSGSNGERVEITVSKPFPDTAERGNFRFSDTSFIDPASGNQVWRLDDYPNDGMNNAIVVQDGELIITMYTNLSIEQLDDLYRSEFFIDRYNSAPENKRHKGSRPLRGANHDAQYRVLYQRFRV